jgi:hypothetical protein
MYPFPQGNTIKNVFALTQPVVLELSLSQIDENYGIRKTTNSSVVALM